MEDWSLKSGPREFVIRADHFTVGRGNDADLQLDHESVSRRHAVFSREADVLVIEDMQSRNGTFVNGQPITGRVRVAPGDRIAFGSCELVLRRAGGPASFAAERGTAPIDPSAGAVTSPPLASLSPREREVFALLAEGIAQR